MKCSKILVGYLLVMLHFLCSSSAVQSAEMRLNVDGTYHSLDIEGRIESGDYERFIKIVKESQGNLNGIKLFSPGGDFMEAIKIGRALRTLELSSNVPNRGRDGRAICGEFPDTKPRDPANCTAVSAAFFIHIGGMHRGGTYLAVHRPYFDPMRLKHISQSQAQAAYELLQQEARAYMSEMGLPPHIQEEVLNTPSDNLVFLDEKTIRTHIWGDLPYRYEWRKAKCSKMSPSQEMQLQGLSAKIISGARLMGEDNQLYESLSPLRDQQMQCGAKLTAESRKVAYEKFFGASPSDVGNHNFGKWLDGPKYLGRTFEDIASDERFEAEPEFVKTSSSMKRNATATSPGASVADFEGKRRFVNWVHIFRESPTPEFAQKVRATLEGAWGKGIEEGSDITWTTPRFNAKLTYRKEGAQPGIGVVVRLPNRSQ